MKIVGYTGEWTSDALANVVRFCAARCKYFLLIRVDAANAALETPLDELRQYMHSRTHVTAWPGTVKLSGDQHEMLKFNATEASCDILINRVLPELATAAPRVEDLSLLREDGRPFFVTITHEHDAFFKIDEAEMHELATAIGVDNLVEEGDDQLPEETY